MRKAAKGYFPASTEKEVGGRNLKVNEARPKSRIQRGLEAEVVAGSTGTAGANGAATGGRGGKQGGRFSNEDYRDIARDSRASRAG